MPVLGTDAWGGHFLTVLFEVSPVIDARMQQTVWPQRLVLPYPPSMNHYWRRVGPRTLISREGRTFRKNVCALLGGGGPRKPPAGGRIALCMDAFPPDRRRRDLDNIQKPTLDVLEHAADLIVKARDDIVDAI